MPTVKKKPHPSTHAVHSASSTTTTKAKKKPVLAAENGATRAGGLAAAAAKVKAKGDVGAVAAKLAKEAKASGQKVVLVLNKPTHATAISARFECGGSEGRVLKPGEQIILEIPAALRKRAVSSVILVHRQESGKQLGENGWDETPGMTAAHVHDSKASKSNAWRTWTGPFGSSGSEGAKFAEPRSSGDPEFENEFGWGQHGHERATGGDSSTDRIYADAMRIKSVGESPVIVHGIELIVEPEKPDHAVEVAFCKGTKLGDIYNREGMVFGGGQSFGGKFKGALTLGTSGLGEGASKLPSGWSQGGYGELEISLKAKQRITSVEVACGDSHPDGVHNKDGGTGTPGWSRLSMSVRRANGGEDVFVNSMGVPPEGILLGAPRADYVAKAGDKLIISAESDTTYVMGLRVGFKDS